MTVIVDNTNNFLLGDTDDDGFFVEAAEPNDVFGMSIRDLDVWDESPEISKVRKRAGRKPKPTTSKRESSSSAEDGHLRGHRTHRSSVKEGSAQRQSRSKDAPRHRSKSSDDATLSTGFAPLVELPNMPAAAVGGSSSGERPLRRKLKSNSTATPATHDDRVGELMDLIKQENAQGETDPTNSSDGRHRSHSGSRRSSRSKSPTRLQRQRSQSPTRLQRQRSRSPTRLQRHRSRSPTRLQRQRSRSPTRLQRQRSKSPSRLRQALAEPATRKSYLPKSKTDRSRGTDHKASRRSSVNSSLDRFLADTAGEDDGFGAVSTGRSVVSAPAQDYHHTSQRRPGSFSRRAKRHSKASDSSSTTGLDSFMKKNSKPQSRRTLDDEHRSVASAPADEVLSKKCHKLKMTF